MNILDLIFPTKCLECGKEGKYICTSCLKKVAKNGWNSDWVYSIWKNEGVIRQATFSIQNKYSTKLVEELTEIVTRHIKRGGIDIEGACLVPVPIHWYTKNLRGFSQSEEIGKVLSKKMGWRYIPDILLKGKSFQVNLKYKNSLPKTVILFEDVLSKGLNLLEASKILKANGVERILCLTIVA